MSGFISTLSSGIGAVSALASLAFGASGGVVLDSFVFAGFEVPEYITVPGTMGMTVHKMPGGERVIDMLGDDPGDIAWSGTFIDGQPDDRARELEHLRSAGDPLGLQWGPYFYTVVIRSYSFKTMYSRVSYDIACTVLRNEATAPGGVDPDLTNAVGGDILTAALGAPAALAPSLTTAQAAVAALGPLIPGGSKVAMGLAQLSGVNAQLAGLTASAGNAIGGIGKASDLIANTSNAGDLAQSLASNSYVGRAIRNLS